MDQGWIKIHRKIIDSPVFSSGDEHLLQLWIYILLSVNHKDKKVLFNGEEITVREGCGIFGLNSIVENIKKIYNHRTKKFKKFKTIYYRKLKILEKMGNVKLHTTNKITIIEVLNWSSYQQNETQVKLNRNSSETQVKTNKNVKNVKNVKNKNTSRQSLPVNEIFNIFYEINPTINYANQTNRKSAEWLIKKFGIEETKRMAQLVVGVQGKDKYAPVATTPHQMKEKLAQFQIYFKNNQSKTLTV